MYMIFVLNKYFNIDHNNIDGNMTKKWANKQYNNLIRIVIVCIIN
jgi:hypothetical protein